MFAGLAPAVARADDNPAPPPAPAPAPATTPVNPATAAARRLPLRVVRMLTDTHQALLYDKHKGTHVLVELGTRVDGFVVDDIGEDTITLSPVEGGTQLVLAGPDPSWLRRRDAGAPHAEAPRPRTGAATTATAVPGTETPETDPATPIDPYGDPDGDPDGNDDVRSIEAPQALSAVPAPAGPSTATTPTTPTTPIHAGQGGVRTVEAPRVVMPSATIAVTAAPTAASSSTTSATPVGTSPTAAPVTPSSTPDLAASAVPAAAPEATPAASIDTSSNVAWSGLPDPTAAALAGTITGTPTATPTATAPAPATTSPVRSVSAKPGSASTIPGAALGTGGPTVIARADVTAALANFGALAGSVHGAFVAEGARIDAVAPDSVFAKAGLKAGDTITSINHQPLRSLDDAANLYASAGRLRTATIQLARAGKPLTLQIRIQ